MKKTIFAMALIALSLVSCTKDENPTNDLKPKATAFASASIKLEAEKASNPTGKTVERGTLHAWIKDVNVTVTSLDWNYGPFTTNFQLVDNTSNNTDNINYVIDKVALGNTKFDVITTTSTTGEDTFVAGAKATATADWDLAKAKNPFAIYSTTFNAIVHDSGQLTPNYAQTLRTQHGRGIGVFKIGEDLLGLGGSAIVVQGGRTVTVNSTTNGNFYLSNNDSTDGDVITFSVQILDKNGVPFGAAMLTTLQIIKSSSVNNTYIINKTGIKIEKTMEQFIAEPWVNHDGTVIVG